MKIVVLIFCVSCAAARSPPTLMVDYPGELTSPSDHPGAFVRRQQITARYGNEVRSFEAVLQKQDDTLTLIGLLPFGKAFVLEQRGREVSFQSFLPRDPPFPPRFVLQDIHRTYFGGIGDGVLSDGEHAIDRNGEHLREVWSGGRLLERHFARLDGQPPGEIVIRYDGGMAPGLSPKRLVLDNGWFAYQLTIETVSEEPLLRNGVSP